MATPATTPQIPDALALRGAFGHFATGICVLGAETVTGERLGLTLNSFSSLSLDPPLLLVSLGHFLRSHDQLIAARGFGLSILAEDQVEISQRFASREGLKWRDFPAVQGRLGGLTVPSAMASFDCAVERSVPAGDHTILIGRVLDCTTHETARPLLYFRGRYDRIAHAN